MLISKVISRNLSVLNKQAYHYMIVCLIMLVNNTFQEWVLMGNTDGIAGSWDILT
jgi:hypothetical protein